MSFVSTKSVVTEAAARIAAHGTVLTSRLDPEPLEADVVIILDADGLARGSEPGEQRLGIPVHVLVRVDEEAADVAAERRAQLEAAETLLATVVGDLTEPDASAWSYAWHVNASSSGFQRPDLGGLYATARTRVAFAVESI